MNAYAQAVATVPVPARVAEIRARIAPPTSPARADASSFEAALADAQSGSRWTNASSGAPFAYTSTSLATGFANAYTVHGRGWTVAGATGQDAAPIALRYVGVPYVWGGNDPAIGLDCSGFTKLVFGSLGVSLPRVSTDQATMGTPVASLAEAQPGDLLAFGSPVDHVAIYLGDGRMVHAAGTGKGVRVDDVYRTPAAIRRLLPSSPPSGAPVVTNAAGSYSGAESYSPLFELAGARHGVDPALLSAVARAESGYDRDAMSRAGALGLMQFMPATAAGLGIDPLDPEQAVDGAARYLAQQVARFGSVELALAAYNAGPGAVSRYGGIPPFAETQAYVAKVLSFRDEITGRFGDQNTLGVPA
jgi:cell wall-associated NlpC family hydrolase